MKRTLLAGLLAAALPMLASGCSDDEEEVVLFRALLVQVNPQASGAVPSATVQIAVQGSDVIEVDVQGVGLDPVDHPTFLRTGDSCPVVASDTNGDGVVDIAEGQAAYGNILLPFDADITTQSIEFGTFPLGSSPQYSAIERFDQVLAAVTGPDSNPNDPIVTLGPGEVLGLDHRTVVIHGVSAAVVDPRPTVVGLAGAPELTVAATVPILCGRLIRVS